MQGVKHNIGSVEYCTCTAGQCILLPMLESLRIRNLAIAEDISVEFAPGLNVITGETGAGKSLLAAALNLVLGERADKSMIRAGEDKCVVEASFHLAEPGGADAILTDLGLDPCDDKRLIIRRVVSSSGSGRNLVNDCSTTLQALKEIGNLLVDQHGPHDHQSLLEQGFQLEVLDAFGHTEDALAAYRELYQQIQELNRRRLDLEGDDQGVAQQIDMLSFQVKEIDDAALTPDEDNLLEQELTVVANAARILELAGQVTNGLTEDEASVFSSLVTVQNAASELADIMGEVAKEWLKDAESLAIGAQELSASITSSIQNVEGDPGRLQWLEDRMALIHKLKRKYGATTEEILQFREKAFSRLGELESRGERLAAVDAEMTKLNKKLMSAGKKLRELRTKASAKLATKITGELSDLGFPHGAFDVSLVETEPNPSGLDEVDFGFAPNVGEPMRPLRAIASSGEISRVMLATKSVLASHDRIPVLVFDEVDANVGGEMGHAIGTKLSRVAENHQVLCITHLPQVAVHGKTHFVVAKEVRDDRTRTSIAAVEKTEREEEVARMLGGLKKTSVTLQHAREMLAAV